MAWFRRETAPLAPRPAESRVPEGVWVKCNNCKEILYRKDVLKNLSVCPKCAFHFRIGARERLNMLFDGKWEEFDRNLVSSDPLDFAVAFMSVGYPIGATVGGVISIFLIATFGWRSPSPASRWCSFSVCSSAVRWAASA